MNSIFALLPVVIFLLFLFLLDSFKLVVKKQLLLCIVWGILSATLAYFINTLALNHFQIGFDNLSKYISPFIEELLKIVVVLILIKSKRIGFMIDAAIYGFAAGAGFALAENIFYLYTNNDPNLLIWIIRGLGTSIMHGGCTALFALVVVGAKNRDASPILNFMAAIGLAYLIHSMFNHFYVSPIIQTAGIVVVLPLVFILIFNFNEKQLQDWLEIEFANEVELLNMINKGQFRNTKAGEYLTSLKSKFEGEVILDMYCFISLYLELSIKAKRNIMLKESGFAPMIEPDINNKLSEIKQLRKQIGKVGELTLAPLIRMNYRDLWKLKTLE
ncbi:MAG: PrsW family intramembrane metalloprotease [Prolixibacteraceae bacterium]|nr:PrsW family intramembrane metalloprotease [Prolixibacteraceae bacterium]MBN2650440.1 PrsW family intramembrane metalloprotease [Prolixibacteraceae bacterium]